MRRKTSEAQDRAARAFGGLAGGAFGEGFGDGVARVLARLPEELSPLCDEVMALLRREAGKAGDEEAASPPVPMLQGCVTPGCLERPVARGLCRKHYARQIYQERKARQGLPAPVPRRAARPSAVGEKVPREKKPVAAVAPIVRRRKAAAEPEPAVTEVARAPVEPVESPPPKPDVTVESVARFFGLAK